LAGLLALLGTGVLAHTLFTSATAQRRQLAVLKSIGFDRGDVAATVRWHAIAVVVACLCLAVPVGLAVGRTLWTRFADGLGVAGDALTPTVSVVAVVVGTLAVAVALAVAPGRRAAAVRPSIALRVE
jgi:ABC-type lipoprotein release transport system permease subunit